MKSRVFIVLGFLGAILLGAVLLALPFSNAQQTYLPPSDALFTACSAVCITGLSVIDVGTQLSRTGQSILLFLVQLGCVGIMTLGTFFLVLMGRRLSLSSEFSLMNAFGISGIRGWRGLVLWVIFSMLGIELVGMVALHASAPHLGWFAAYFYAVMSFCNAGFSLGGAATDCLRSNLPAIWVMSSLVILGGLGFLVIYNLCTIQFWRRNLVKRGRLSLHTRVVLMSSLILLAIMFLIFLVLEWRTTLKPFSFVEKVTVTFFQAITPRTCGFTILPIEDLHSATRFVYGLMMFIGAGPGGAGGGIKVTTLAVFVVSLVAICQARREVVMFNRSISETIVREAIVIVMVFSAVISLAMTLLLITEHGSASPPFEDLYFETVSAVTTTGLSCGQTTRLLSEGGRFVIMACMLCGRLGALAIVFLIGGKEERLSIRYPREELVVG